MLLVLLSLLLVLLVLLLLFLLLLLRTSAFQPLMQFPTRGKMTAFTLLGIPSFFFLVDGGRRLLVRRLRRWDLTVLWVLIDVSILSNVTCTCIPTQPTTRPTRFPIQLAFQPNTHPDPDTAIIKAEIHIGPLLELSRQGGIHIHFRLVESEHASGGIVVGHVRRRREEWVVG